MKKNMVCVGLPEPILNRLKKVVEHIRRHGYVQFGAAKYYATTVPGLIREIVQSTVVDLDSSMEFGKKLKPERAVMPMS